MDTQEVKTVKREYMATLNHIIELYCSIERKSKIILGVIGIICAIALYFVLGYILTIVIIAVGLLCIVKLDITFNNSPVSDGKLAYQACIAMYFLVEIEKGTYRTDMANIIYVNEGKHLDLYDEFIRLYPNFSNKSLKKLAKIEISRKDMF